MPSARWSARYSYCQKAGRCDRLSYLPVEQRAWVFRDHPVFRLSDLVTWECLGARWWGRRCGRSSLLWQGCSASGFPRGELSSNMVLLESTNLFSQSKTGLRGLRRFFSTLIRQPPRVVHVQCTCAHVRAGLSKPQAPKILRMSGQCHSRMVTLILRAMTAILR